MYRCTGLSGVPVCCAEELLLGYGYPTACKLKGRDKENDSCCHRAGITHHSLFFTEQLFHFFKTVLGKKSTKNVNNLELEEDCGSSLQSC